MILAAVSLSAPARAQYDYRIVDLGVLRGTSSSIAHGINNNGEVVGVSGGRAFLWLPTSAYGLQRGMHNLNDVSLGGPGTSHSSRAWDINDSGGVAGDQDPISASRAYYWDLNDINNSGVQINTGSEARAVSKTGSAEIVGKFLSPELAFRLPIGGVSHQLDPVDFPNQNFLNSRANDIAPNGRVVGRSLGGQSNCAACNGGSVPCNLPTYWEEGTDSPTVLPAPGAGAGEAFGINSSLQIVGVTLSPSVCRSRAIFWEPDGSGAYTTFVELPNLPGISNDDLFAHAVANQFPSGELQAVGRSDVTNAAVLWRRVSGTWEAVDLNSVSVCGDSFDELREAYDINDEGWIVGRGVVGANTHAFLLVPFSTCEGDLQGMTSILPDGCVNVFDLLYLLARWGTDDCLADLNQDAVVDIFDMLELLGNWGPCPGGQCSSGSFSETLTEVGLTTDDWDDFMDVMAGEDEREKENWLCWMTNYLTQCQQCPTCPSGDPFAQ